MKNFGYAARRPTSTAAVAALGDRTTSLIAGGTELLNWMRLGIAAPDRVVDIGRIDELAASSRDGDRAASSGRSATLNEIGEHPLVADRRGRAGLGVPAGGVGAAPQPRHPRRQRPADARAARTSAPRSRCPGRATSAAPGSGCAALRRSERPPCRSSAGPRTASRCSRPTRRWRWPRSTPRSTSPGRAGHRCDRRCASSMLTQREAARTRRRAAGDAAGPGRADRARTALPIRPGTRHRPTSRSANGRRYEYAIVSAAATVGGAGGRRDRVARGSRSARSPSGRGDCRGRAGRLVGRPADPRRRAADRRTPRWPTRSRCRTTGSRWSWPATPPSGRCSLAGGAR